jgi:hypothetical protein
MSINLLSEPLKSNAGVTDSNVLAVRTQARYTFRRIDFDETDVTQVANSGGFAQITTVAAASTLVSLNDRIYFSADSAYDDVGTVTAVNANDFVTDIPINGVINPIVSGVLNNLTTRPNYRVEFQIKNGISLVVILTDLFYATQQDGNLVVDLKETYLFLIDDSSVDVSQLLQAEFKEVFTGSSDSFTALTKIQAIKSKRQLLTGTGFGAEGSNLVNFLLFNNKADQSVILTKIRKVWRNWTATTNFIWDDGAGARVGNTIRRVVDRLDINQSLLGNKTNGTITPSTADIFSFTITTTSAFTADFLQVYFRDSPDALDLSGRVDFKVEEECENPIMISWINSLGGTEQFLFSFNQDIDDTTNVGITTVPPIIDDIAFVDAGIARTEVVTTQRITLFADHLNNVEIRAMHEIKHSEHVEVWLDKAGSLRKIDVIVEDTYTTSYTTRSPLNFFEVKIRFPDDFDFFEGKTY